MPRRLRIRFVPTGLRFAPQFPAFVPNRKPTRRKSEHNATAKVNEARVESKSKNVNRKHLSLAGAALLAAGSDSQRPA